MRKFVVNVFRSMFSQKHLLVTNTIVSGTLMGLGDCVQQNIEKIRKGKHEYDLHRTARMASVGLICGPFVHGWYKLLDTVLKGNSTKTVVKKVFVDQMIASPSLLVAFFVGMGALEGKKLKSSIEEIKEKFVFVYIVDCIFWPPVQVLNFYFLPPNLRVLYVSSAVLLWNTFLSYIKHKDTDITPVLSESTSSGRSSNVAAKSTSTL